MISYGYTILYVENVEKTLEFYTKAFGFTQKMITHENDYGELDTGSTTLAFASFDVASYNGVDVQKSAVTDASFPFEIAFVTDEIDSTWKQAVDAGAIVVKEPMQKPWGQTVGYLRDGNGILIELCTKM